MGVVKEVSQDRFNVGDRVRVKDGGEWWFAVIKSTKNAKAGRILYNIVSDDHDEETSWEMYDVSPNNIRKRHSNYPFSQVSLISEGSDLEPEDGGSGGAAYCQIKKTPPR